MRYALAACFLLLTGLAHADPADDFAACLVGYGVMAIENGADADAAMRAAADQCPLPDDPKDEIDVDAIAAHANELVSTVAKGALAK